eukprot:TRINITY_DN228_c0_g1_i2.p2 TRINITY_DN228_c0_g1~~TRINITY_DN228_c0_g1_i2.p2  ORF type:complete len:188 (+),score=57.71 TRINITY_DN228_c0_g1_i2:67-630(+)
MAVPDSQAMRSARSTYQNIESKFTLSFPRFKDITDAGKCRTACCCYHCTPCHKPKNHKDEDSCLSCGYKQQCICCGRGGMCHACDCSDDNKAWDACDGTIGCCDYRSGETWCFIAGVECVQCCCASGKDIAFCHCEELTCCKSKFWCCCLYEACALPCDDDVPFEIGLCGIMCKSAEGADSGNEPAK